MPFGMTQEQYKVSVDKLTVDHMELARNVARKVHRTAPHALEVEELISISYTGLIQVSQRWHPYCEQKTKERQLAQDVHYAEYLEEHGTAEGYQPLWTAEQIYYDPSRMDFFAVVARRRCFGAIMDVFRSRDFATRSLRAKNKILQEAGQDAGATVAELSDRTGMSKAEVNKVQRGMNKKQVSLEADGTDFEVPQTTESMMQVQLLLETLTKAYLNLSDDAKVIIALHYVEQLELQKIAKRLRVPENIVSNIHTESVLLLHSAMEDAARQGMQDEVDYHDE